jgi:hypothetical protein
MTLHKVGARGPKETDKIEKKDSKSKRRQGHEEWIEVG